MEVYRANHKTFDKHFHRAEADKDFVIQNINCELFVGPIII